jgi:catechol 2,3-dioxygenase-like lactoylglutathione lyase family enzyme
MTIIKPLLPQLGVADVERSLRFYREVLGFAVNFEHREDGRLAVIEVQLGAAKLQLGAHDGVGDTPDQRGARHATILFFETDDVDALRAAIVSRGGRPSEIEPVHYWMKMRLFEIEDPDAHSLWFGQRVVA